jgi:elongation factor P
MRPLNLEFPEWVDLRVTTAPPPLHEQDSTTGYTLTLENNMEILAPQFIQEGDTVRVNVESGKYMERV